VNEPMTVMSCSEASLVTAFALISGYGCKAVGGGTFPVSAMIREVSSLPPIAHRSSSGSS
jgi:hypothetical protein